MAGLWFRENYGSPWHPSFSLFPGKIVDNLGTGRDRQRPVESRAWANSANTQRGGPRPHGGCLSVTGGINTTPTLKALQKRHGYSNSCDMQPVPCDSEMNKVLFMVLDGRNAENTWWGCFQLSELSYSGLGLGLAALPPTRQMELQICK